ncbi:MAG: DUF937 domain-containing protein [Saprospiraceae bacterium]
MDLMSMVQRALSGGLLDQFSRKTGADAQQTETAASGVVNTIIGALTRNASTEEGAGSLSNALDRDHDGGILDDLMDKAKAMLGGSEPTDKSTDGASILKHILGDKTSAATEMISKSSGLDTGAIGGLMTTLAPIIMGALGKIKKSQGLDASGVTDVLTKTVQNANQSPMMDMVSRFLDKDGDGSVLDDLADMGSSLFGKFMKP